MKRALIHEYSNSARVRKKPRTGLVRLDVKNEWEGSNPRLYEWR